MTSNEGRGFGVTFPRKTSYDGNLAYQQGMAFSLYGNWYLDMTMHVIIVVLLVHTQRKAGSSTDSVILQMSFPSFNKLTTEGGFVNFHKEH